MIHCSKTKWACKEIKELKGWVVGEGRWRREREREREKTMRSSKTEGSSRQVIMSSSHKCLTSALWKVEKRTLNRTTTSLLLAITIPSRGFSKAFLSSESCRISDSVALSSGFLLSIQRSSLFVNSYSCTGVQVLVTTHHTLFTSYGAH